MTDADVIERLSGRLRDARSALAEQDQRDDDALATAVSQAQARAETMRRGLDRRIALGMPGSSGSGKSALLGALLGNPNLLPTADNATTGNITVLRVTQAGPGAPPPELHSPTVEMLELEELRNLSRALLDALVAAARHEGLSPADESALTANDPIADDFALVDRWLGSHWPGGRPQESLLATVSREILDLRDAWRCGRGLVGQGPLRLRTAPEDLLQLDEPEPLGAAFRPGAQRELDRAEVEREAAAQRALFPLYRHVTYEVAVAPEVWPLDGFEGHGQVVLVDFPGLGSRVSPVRDAFLSGKELADIQTVGVCQSITNVAHEDVARLCDLLRRHGREADDLTRTLFLVATRFDEMGPPMRGNALGLTLLRQFDADCDDFVAGSVDQVAVVSTFAGIRGESMPPPRGTDSAARYEKFLATPESDWLGTTETLATPRRERWETLLRAAAHGGGLGRLRGRLAAHAVLRGNAVKREQAEKDADELYAALRAVREAERQIGWRESEEAAAVVEDFLRDVHNVAASMNKRVPELQRVDAIAADLERVAAQRVYTWPTWDIVLSRAVGGVIPRTKQAAEDGDDPPTDRTETLQRAFEELVRILCVTAANALAEHSEAWDAAETRRERLRDLWDGTGIRTDLVGLLRRTVGSDTVQIDRACREIDRILDAEAWDEEITAVTRRLAEFTPSPDAFPMRSAHLQPWAHRAPEVADDRAVRHRMVVLRTRTALADAAALTARTRLRLASAEMVASVQGRVEAVRTHVPREIPPRPPLPPLRGRRREELAAGAAEPGSVAKLLRHWEENR